MFCLLAICVQAGVAPANLVYSGAQPLAYSAPLVSAYNPLIARSAPLIASNFAAPAFARQINPLAYSQLAYNAPLVARSAPLVQQQFVQPAQQFLQPAQQFIQPAQYVARAAPLVAAQPINAPVLAKQVVAAPLVAQAEFADSHPQYSYGYTVNDALTGDSKTQEESRDGDVVKGSYSLIEPDGSRRTVNYYSDPINGFNAVVSKDLPLAAPVVAGKIVAAAPAVIAA